MFQVIASFLVDIFNLSGKLAAALQFWIYDTLKIVFVMFLVVSVVSFFRTFVPPEKIREYLKKRGKVAGYLLASLFGIISPFCSCSTLPLFLGIIGAGIPFGMAITFLFVSPMVNEAALVVLFTNLGWEIALTYLLGGLAVGIFGGWLLTRLGFERYLVDFQSQGSKTGEDEILSLKERTKEALKETKRIVGKILPYVLVGVGVGALIHGYLPDTFIENTLQGAFGVPMAVLVGIPIYTNILGVIPVAESLIAKGLPVGTALAFLMSVAALSLPQFIMLKKVMKKKLILAYGVIVGFGIMFLGFVFNIFL